MLTSPIAILLKNSWHYGAFLDSVEQMRLGEDDVERLESATATFLKELGLSRRTWQKQRRVLQ